MHSNHGTVIFLCSVPETLIHILPDLLGVLCFIATYAIHVTGARIAAANPRALKRRLHMAAASTWSMVASAIRRSSFCSVQGTGPGASAMCATVAVGRQAKILGLRINAEECCYCYCMPELTALAGSLSRLAFMIKFARYSELPR
jgi:hypothetical protein